MVPNGPTVAELLVRFLRHAETLYRHPDGSPTGTMRNIKNAVRRHVSRHVWAMLELQ